MINSDLMIDRFDDDDDGFELLQQLQNIFLHQVAAFEEDEEEVALAAAGIVVYLEQAVEEIIGARRARRQQYLVCEDLLPNPRQQTPWQVLYKNQNDCAFITTMGFDTSTFQLILDGGFEELWNTTSIACSDTDPDGLPRVWRRSLDAAGALGLVLHYLSSTMLDVSLCEIFALIPVSVYRYITFSLPLLLQVLRKLPESRVSFPQGF